MSPLSPLNPASPMNPANPMNPSAGMWNPASPYYHVYGPGAQQSQAEVRHESRPPADGGEGGDLVAWGVVLLAVLLGGLIAWAVVETR